MAVIEEHTLRTLRLWHWRRAMCAAAVSTEYAALGRAFAQKSTRSKADFHIAQVQLLNDVVDGTAEQDNANAQCDHFFEGRKWRHVVPHCLRCGRSRDDL